MRTRRHPLGSCSGFILREDEVILNIEHPLTCLMESLTNNFLSVTWLDFSAKLSKIYARLWHLITTQFSEIVSLHVSPWITYLWQWIWLISMQTSFFKPQLQIKSIETLCATLSGYNPRTRNHCNGW